MEAAKRERMQRQGPPPPFSGLLPPHREGVMDGPMGRNPPTFGGTPQNQRPGMGGGVGFFGLNNAPPNNIRPGPGRQFITKNVIATKFVALISDTKLTDVQKILQTFKGDGLSQRPVCVVSVREFFEIIKIPFSITTSFCKTQICRQGMDIILYRIF